MWDAGEELAGVADAGVVGEADDVALQPRVVDEEGAVGEAEEVENGARDPLGDRGGVGHGHELGDLREIADFDFELAGVNHGLREVGRKRQVVRGVGKKNIALDNQTPLAPRSGERVARRAG